jgi:hypothetical protein
MSDAIGAEFWLEVASLESRPEASAETGIEFVVLKPKSGSLETDKVGDVNGDVYCGLSAMRVVTGMKVCSASWYRGI